jgi:transglutaminase-like putative cysteine protease
MKLGMFRWLAVVSWLACSTVVAAEKEEAPELFAKTERYNVDYVINADGSFVETREWATKVVKEQAVDYLKQTSISYSTSIQKADVIAAYTLKADGRRIDVPQSNFQVETNGGKGDGGPVFSDVTTMTVVFPELAVNDTVVFSYKLTGNKPMFDGHFSTVESFRTSRYYGDVRIRIDAPASLWTQHHAWQLKEVRDEQKGDRRIVEWTWQNRSPVKDARKDWSVYELGQAPGLAYSTFRDYASIADAYGARAQPKATVTPRIQKLADEVVAGRKEPRDVAQALYDWVATNISYAGNCIGLGAVVPRDTDFVLDNRMGDCKDHATLLQAMLTAKGVASQQALINAGNSYTLPKVPVVSMVNHVITYLPDMDLYLDSTSSSTPFGMLPPGSSGKPVLLVNGYRDGSRTPGMPLGSNRQRMVTTLKVLADGSVSGQVNVHVQGIFAAASRAGFRDVSDEQRKEMVKNYFQAMGHIGSGSIEWDDAKSLLDKHRYGAQFEVKSMLPVPGAFPVQPAFFNMGGVATFAASGADEVEGKFDTACGSGYSEEEYTYEFAKELKVLAVPPNLSLANDVLTYSATYELRDNVLKVKRVFDDRTPGPTCTPAFNATYKEFVQKVLPNLKAQVVYGSAQ